jgi:hypothetical protein
MKRQRLSTALLLMGLAAMQILFAFEGRAAGQASPAGAEPQTETSISIADQNEINNEQKDIDKAQQDIDKEQAKIDLQQKGLELQEQALKPTGHLTASEVQDKKNALQEDKKKLQEDKTHLRDMRFDLLERKFKLQQKKFEYLNAIATKAPATGAPSNAVPALIANIGYTDITCRPKLDVAELSYTWKKEDGNLVAKPSSPGAVSDRRADCVPLAPLTRLILENSDFVVSGGYSNSAGVSNGLLPGNQLITTATTTYFGGFGYAKKPILKQLRGLFYKADSREAIALQGTFWEDFFWNAITLDASYSWGRQLQVKGGMPVDTFNTRPFYSVTGTYTADLEKLYIDVKNTVLNTQKVSPVRPADQGWYFAPQDPNYYHQPTGETFGSAQRKDYWSRKSDQPATGESSTSE